MKAGASDTVFTPATRQCLWSLAVAILAIGLTACQGKRDRIKPSAGTDTRQQPALRERVKDGPWELQGKMALSDGRHSGSGRLWWHKNAGLNSVELIAPLGQGQWQLRETPEKAVLLSSTHGEQSAESAEALLAREIGWPIPWRAMQYWLFGLPETSTATATPKHLQEHGWDISYSRYKATDLGLLPHKIVARKSPYQVKIFIKSWHFPNTSSDSETPTESHDN